MNNVYSAEIYRLKKTKGSYIIVAIYALLLIFLTIDRAIANLESNSMFLLVESTGQLFVLFSITGIAVSNFENNVMKNILSSGNSRKDIYRGKLVCAVVMTCVYILVALVIAIIGIAVRACVSGNFNVMNVTSADGSLGNIALKFLLGCVSLIMYALLFYGVAMIVQNSRLAYVVNFCIIMALPLTQEYLANVTGITLIRDIQFTVSFGKEISNNSGNVMIYISAAIFIALVVVSNIIGQKRLNKVDV